MKILESVSYKGEYFWFIVKRHRRLRGLSDSLQHSGFTIAGFRIILNSPGGSMYDLCETFTTLSIIKLLLESSFVLCCVLSSG